MKILALSLADPGGGAHPVRAPPPSNPNGRGPMILMPKTLLFLIFFVARFARDSFLCIILIEIWPKHAKNDFYFNLQHFHLIFYPPPRWQSPRPP